MKRAVVGAMLVAGAGLLLAGCGADRCEEEYGPPWMEGYRTGVGRVCVNYMPDNDYTLPMPE